MLGTFLSRLGGGVCRARQKEDNIEGVKSALDSYEAQGLFRGIQNLQNCDQILILGKHLERKRGEGNIPPEH